jgi:hypothetical protein
METAQSATVTLGSTSPEEMLMMACDDIAAASREMHPTYYVDSTIPRQFAGFCSNAEFIRIYNGLIKRKPATSLYCCTIATGDSKLAYIYVYDSCMQNAYMRMILLLLKTNARAYCAINPECVMNKKYIKQYPIFKRAHLHSYLVKMFVRAGITVTRKMWSMRYDPEGHATILAAFKEKMPHGFIVIHDVSVRQDQLRPLKLLYC